MGDTAALSAEERDFFALLADVIFANPFSTERAQVESMLGDLAQGTGYGGEHHYSLIVPVLEERLSQLEGRGVDRIEKVSAQDRTCIEYAFLFQVYHHYVDAFDALIQDQINAGEVPVEVPFAEELLGRLHSRGFGRDDALRYMALFYQLRRAYYFIARALVGVSPSMKRLRHALWNNVFTRDVRAYGEFLWDRMEDFSTLLLGETGTGKGAAAAAIGRSGLIPFDSKAGRFKVSFTETFVAINLSQYPESLIESELFGHRKGAFTGAVDHHKGLFERCSVHGSLFLDEIGDVSVPVQIKLLNILQERRFSPVGSHKPMRFAGRVIAATNRPLATLRREGRFRDDFFYRLSSDVIEVPPLRVRLQETPGELEELVSLLVSRLTGRQATPLEEQVLEGLRAQLSADYPWPGNVRELEQAVRRLMLCGEYRGEAVDVTGRDPWLDAAAQGALTAQELLGGYCRKLYRQLGTYEAVAKRAALDRRTIKKYVEAGDKEDAGGRRTDNA